MNIPFFKYVFSMLLFGSNGLVASFIPLNSYEIVLSRTLLGSLSLIAIFVFSREKLTFYKNTTHFLFLCISGISMGTSWMFLYEAYKQLGVSIASLYYNCGPIIIVLLSPLIFKEKLTYSKIISFLVVLCGVFLINNNFSSGNNFFGIFCGIMSAVTYSLMVIFNKKAASIKGLENSMLQLLIAFITVFIFVGVKQGYSIELNSSYILPILVLGFINTGFGCYLFFSSIGKLPVQTVSIFGYLELACAVVFSVLFLNETLLPPQILGAVLIAFGAIFAEYFQNRKKQ